ncbi:HEAT repeat domain-containing protein [Chondromyces apiculatus]|uniref:WD domain G-beta repeat/PBS lyase HEAT-like repeat protein n=1 Tax=Chondromyces apiculatus DSM 436 TaxID=1192034 RepID=A0A017SZM6_9BACT|nr:HEAT repeat domain-containing protein [Chondromyces apiculatus]EYF02439.1 WD domain G-beta repeat/PBS lyase HEAT-like repeat protein [Chondromyces apiculatus DSM 436]
MSHQIEHFEKVRALAATSRLLAVGGVRAAARGGAGTASEVTLYDDHANKRLRSIAVDAHVLGLAFVPVAGGGEPAHLAAACSDGKLRVLSVAEGSSAGGKGVAAHAGVARAVAASPRGDRLATVGDDGSLKLWTLGAGAALTAGATFALSTAPLRAVAFDPGGELCAAAGDDGVVRVVTLASGAVREMPGHKGGVLALAFTPRDGRLASAGEDGTIRLWYLVGEVEFESRGEGGTGHTGAVNALLFLPPIEAQVDGKEVSDRFLSAGEDGKVKVWRLEDRRKPRTIETSTQALQALAFAPGLQQGTGILFYGGDRRTVWRQAVDAAGLPVDRNYELSHGFASLGSAMSGAKPAREAALKKAAQMTEPEALELVLQALRQDKDAEIRSQAAMELAVNGVREARPKLREALDDAHAMVRQSAFEALRELDKDSPLSALRAALAAKSADIRCRALSALPALKDASPLVPGLIADKLSDRDATVRLTALSELMRLYPGQPEPLRTAFERGPADLRAEVLLQATTAGWLSTPVLGPIVARALDDENSDVRRLAFAAKVIERRALSHVLEAKDPDLGRTVKDIARRLAQAKLGLTKGPVAIEAAGGATDAKGKDGKGKDGKGKDGKGAVQVSEEAIAQARASIPGVGAAGAEPAEADLEPLLTAMACRTPDTAVRGAWGLAQLGDMRALGALLQLTREQDPGLRRLAAMALSVLHDSRAEKRLVWMLDDADASVRAAALDAFGQLALKARGPLAVAQVALRSSHQDIRVRGLDALVKLPAEGERPAEAEALLADAVEDEAAKVRGEAFRTLWSWHAKDPERALDRALAARFPDLRLRAVEELRAAGDKPWARERLEKSIGDRDAAVAQAAYEAVVKLRGVEVAEPHLAAMGSVHPALRVAGARGARAASASALRSALLKQLEDAEPGPRIAAVEALARVLPGENGPIAVGLQSSFLDLRVRAAELCAERREERLVDPMRALLADKELQKQAAAMPAVAALRRRASSTLATLGLQRLLRYFATELLKDEDPGVREQAARGLAMAARPGDEGFLLDALGHQDIAVRSWAADGLARLGDVRALPVLIGTLRHDHAPIRVATIMSFAALGPEGFGGMLQGLEDPSREVQELVFALVMARDLRAFRRGDPPDLLTSALSSQRSDVRFAAARALELRTDPEEYLAHLIEVLTPPKPAGAGSSVGKGAEGREEKADGENAAGEDKRWPSEQERARILVGLAEALAGDSAEQRYAAAQVLRLRAKAGEYFREARQVGQLRAAGKPYLADTTPRGPEETDAAPQKGWLRRLFARDDGGRAAEAAPAPAEGVRAKVGGIVRNLFGRGESAATAATAAAREAEAGVVSVAEQQRLRWLAFGAYLGLLRQVSPGDDEGHRVRRDAIDRIVDLCAKGHVSETAAIPPLTRALEDPNHLVRRAALAGLKALFPAGSEEPLALALGSSSADVARAVLDELSQRGEAARPRIVRALNAPVSEVRRYAFEILERLSPKGSLEPLLAALGSEHADLRLGVLDRLATASDARIVPALYKAMESEHDDLRLRAAELTARRRDDRAVDVLAAFLRADQPANVNRAREALVALGSPAAVQAVATWMEEQSEAGARAAGVRALGAMRHVDALGALIGRFEDEAAEVRAAAFQAALDVVGAPWGVDRRRSAEELESPKVPTAEATAQALRFLRAAAHAKDVALRLSAARELVFGDDPEAGEILVPLFADRDAPTRIAAVSAYAKRVIEKQAPTGPVEAVLRAGSRELMLAAAEATAARGLGAALRPLLLFSRAGEGGERERALLGLGTLGDPRATEELETVAGGGTKEAPVEVSMQAAATEALGRLAAKQAEGEARRRLVGRVEQALEAEANDVRMAAARALRWLGGERSRVLLERTALSEDGSSDALRVAATVELGHLGDMASEPVLARLLSEGSAELARSARKALDRLFPKDRMRVELLAVESTRDYIAEPAAAYLAKEADPGEVVPRLGKLKNEGLRSRLTMGLLDRPTLPVGALIKLLEEEHASARKAAAYILGAQADRVTSDAEREALRGAAVAAERKTAARWAKVHGAERAVEAAAWRDLVWALRGLRAVAALPTLRSVARGGDAVAPETVRREAVRGLGAMGAAGAGASPDVEALGAALKDIAPAVRMAAAAALAALSPDSSAKAAASLVPFDPVALGPLAAAATPATRATLTGTEPGRRLVLPAVISRKEVEPLLALAKSGADVPSRLDAIHALGRVGGSDVMTLLETLAFDKQKTDIALRKAAYRAYRRAKRRAEREDRAKTLQTMNAAKNADRPAGANA